MHVAPACAGSREGSDHFGSIVRSLSLHFCKSLFPGLEPVTSWSQGSSFYHCAKAPLLYYIHAYRNEIRSCQNELNINCESLSRTLIDTESFSLDFRAFSRLRESDSEIALCSPSSSPASTDLMHAAASAFNGLDR